MGRVLEWAAKAGTVAAGGAATEEESDRLELGLRDNEVAEIHKILLDVTLIEDFDAAKTVDAYAWVSMDPDTSWIGDPETAEDLETIVDVVVSKSAQGILAGTEFVQDNVSSFQFDFNVRPVLVGTDLGLGLYLTTAVGNLDAGSLVYAKVFFTRRKANVSELNQILLKRR
jgi:hypothetical protein